MEIGNLMGAYLFITLVDSCRISPNESSRGLVSFPGGRYFSKVQDNVITKKCILE
jgi:hypothetical protein